MWVSKITEENLTNDVIDRLLFEGLNDKGASADCIIVLGSMKAAEYRVPAAAEALENILCSLLELQRSMWLNKVKSVLLVTTTYHMRRSLHIARYLFPAHISVYPCPADDTKTKRDNWMNTPEGIERVKNEAWNIARCVNNGVIPDFQI